MLDFEEESELQSSKYAQHKKRREQRKKEKLQLLESNNVSENASELTKAKESLKLLDSISSQKKVKNRRKLRTKKTNPEESCENFVHNLEKCDKQLSKSCSSKIKMKNRQQNYTRSVSTSEVDNCVKRTILTKKDLESVTIDLDQLMLQWPGDKNCLTSNKLKTKQKMNSLTVRNVALGGIKHLDLKSKSKEVPMSYTQERMNKSRNIIFQKINNLGEQSCSKSDYTNIQKEKKKFCEYINFEEVKKGLESGELFVGNIRINPKDHKLSYISNPIKLEQDILIISIGDRNGALEGDKVVVKLKDPVEWKTKTQKTGYIVFIIEKVHPRTAIGTLRLMADKNKNQALFHPRDTRVPRIKVINTDCPAQFFEKPEQFENILFLAKITSWTEPRFPFGTIIKTIGISGNLHTESVTILEENCLNVTPYSEDMKQYYPKSGEIDPKEFDYRLDLRQECIFTIDPESAKDLDDAMSCKILQNGNLEIGVHISDVSYYLKEDTPLDKLVENRATSIYMVNTVYHMLPRELCMMCSLLPGEDKLAFSVFWEMTREGKVMSHKFSRTVINSCVQLSYEHAQVMIENPEKQIKESELPIIHNGFKSENLKEVVNNLHKIALNLRKSRYQSGALRIDQPKVSFSLNSDTGLPESYHLYTNKECHRLIEEFMLLANITVATRLRDDYPTIAFLRKHSTPHDYMMHCLKATLEKVGIHLDVSSAGGLQQTLWKYCGEDSLSQARMLVLNMLCAKPMARAQYFCANNSNDTEDYWHYALSVPLYTHFTSPIRRFADIVVHRQLAGSLGYVKKPEWSEEYVITVAGNCNKQKYNAKKAGEQSIELYLIEYIGQNQPMKEKAVVWDVKDGSFDAIVITTGLTVRLYLNNLDDGVKYKFLNDEDDDVEEKDEGKKLKNLLIEWPIQDNKSSVTQIIAIFSIITVVLSKKEKIHKLDAKLCRPED